MKVTVTRLLVSLCCVALTLPLCYGEDFYSILGVSRSSTSSEIKKAYHRLSLKYHPDKNQGDEGAHQRFVEIAQAYEVLSDDGLKRRYDMYGEKGIEGMNKGDASNGFGFGSMNIKVQFGGQTFSFGGGGGGGPHIRVERQDQPRKRFEPREEDEGPPKKGKDEVLDIPLPLENVVTGGQISVTIQKNVLCPVCRGSGHHQHHHEYACNRCGGKGTVRQAAQVPVDIPVGVPFGHEIKYEKYGHQGPNLIPGDVIVNITNAPHKFFERDGADLIFRAPISKAQALHGFDLEVPTLAGSLLHISRDNQTSSGDEHVFEGEGLPNFHDGGATKGALRVIFDIASNHRPS